MSNATEIALACIPFDDCPDFKGISTVSYLLQLICMTADADLQSVSSLCCMSPLYTAVHAVAE
jgi:hypothetical protein